MRLPWQKRELDEIEDIRQAYQYQISINKHQLEINQILLTRISLLEQVVMLSTESYRHIDQRTQH